MDVDNQSIVEQQRKMLEQAEKAVNTELMQQLMQTHTDAREQMKKAGVFEQWEQMKKLVESVALPQGFIFPKEDEQQIIESTETIKNPESDPKEVGDAIRKIEKVVKRNTTRQTRLILQRLIPYFEDDIRYKVQSENPDLDVNKYNKKIKTNFMQEIADDFELSLRRIKQIASDYSDDYEDFLPK